MRTLATITTVLILAGCGGTDLDPNRQRIIDDLGNAKDCPGLQAVFDAAEKQPDGSEEMSYVNDVMRDAGCYEG